MSVELFAHALVSWLAVNAGCWVGWRRAKRGKGWFL